MTTCFYNSPFALLCILLVAAAFELYEAIYDCSRITHCDNYHYFAMCVGLLTIVLGVALLCMAKCCPSQVVIFTFHVPDLPQS